MKELTNACRTSGSASRLAYRASEIIEKPWNEGRDSPMAEPYAALQQSSK
jgi:hypothetical protein